MQALRLGSLSELRRVFPGQQLFAPLDAIGAGCREDLDKRILPTLAHKLGTVAGQTDGNGWFIHCY